MSSFSDEVTSYTPSYTTIHTDTYSSIDENSSYISDTNSSDQKQYRRNVIHLFKREILKSIDDIASLDIMFTDISKALSKLQKENQRVQYLSTLFSNTRALLNDRLNSNSPRNSNSLFWSNLNTFWDCEGLILVLIPYIRR